MWIVINQKSKMLRHFLCFEVLYEVDYSVRKKCAYVHRKDFIVLSRATGYFKSVVRNLGVAKSMKIKKINWFRITFIMFYNIIW